MNRELLVELQKKKDLYDLWKHSQAAQEDCRAGILVDREITGKAKA